jgi:orotate phosphoribosyltransferase
MALFIDNEFTGHAGSTLKFKIECDALTHEDIEAIAAIIARTHTFSKVHGVPRGGLRLAQALEKYVSPDGLTLIVDDVLTSGMSMEEARKDCKDEILGIVIFARGPCPEWVKPVFQLSEWAGP